MRLLLIIGPPAVGKMTIGRAIADRSTFRLFHNHHTIEPLLDVFDFGTPAFDTLNLEFRRRVIEEAAASGTDLIFTFVWGMQLEEDADYVRRLIRPYAEAGGSIAFAELAAGLATRLERNRTEHRLAEKKSKRDLAWSESNVRELERHTMNTGGGTPTPADALLAGFPHAVFDTEGVPAEESAVRILTWLDEVTDK